MMISFRSSGSSDRFCLPLLMSRAVRNAGCLLSIILTLMLPLQAATAQTADPYSDRSTPYGSPFGATGQDQAGASSGSNNGNTNNNNGNSTMIGSTRIEPVEVDSGNGRNDSNGDQQNQNQNTSQNANQRSATMPEPTTKRPAPPSEFEQYVETRLGRKLPRFGANLLIPGTRDFAVPTVTTVPPDYRLNPGDQITIGLSGSVDGTVEAEIDTDGRIFLPKIGAVRVAGVRYADLQGVIMRAIGSQYRDFHASVTVSKLRGIRVYVTGFANNPGAYTVNSLSTLANAVLAAGGPAAGGSFRTIQLYRNGALVTNFDLYDLVRRGDRSRDAVLQNEDVLFIPPVGNQIAITGSVNEEAIYEARPGETLEALLGFAGGVNALADRSRIILYRLSNLDTVGGKQLDAAQVSLTRAEGGDLVQVLSVGSLARPLERQSVLVRVEGEVNHPGNYYVQPNATLAEVMSLAGGLTSRAFVYGTNFQRLSVRLQQRESFEEAIQQLEISLAAAPLTGSQAIDAGTRASQVASARAVLERLRQSQPDGRVVLPVTPYSTSLPGALTLENNDRILVPPRPTTVGVFGAVYRPASFLIEDDRPKKVDAYLKMAGGPLRVADSGQIFVVRANGAVIAKRNGALSAPVLPGDIIFVPVRTQSSSVLAKIVQLSSIFFQLGLSTAAFIAVTN